MTTIGISELRKIPKFLIIFGLALLISFQCKYFEKEDKVGYGKKWMEGPREELFEGNIYYIRNNVNTNSEFLFERHNLDPRALAKLGVIPYVKKLEGYFKNRKYEDVTYQLDVTLFELIGVKLGLLNYIENEYGEKRIQNFGEKEIGDIGSAIEKSLKSGKGYCNLNKFFEVPYKKIEIRAYQAFDPRLDPDTKEPKEYFFTYRIDFVHNLDPNLDENTEERTHAITISMSFDPLDHYTYSKITRVIKYCPIPELQDPVEDE